MIKHLFAKDISRNIETVIKADDRDHISDEVAEYVITQEIARKIRDFFDAYLNYAGANGVWISGFFGSGKSHLLKILSYVLENKSFDGYESGSLFAEKLESDAMLKADVLKAIKIPSESILFNIDQQAQITSKSDANAILSVFYKVFFDHLGYYGFQPHVAEFEMWLSKKGQYQTFKSKFLVVHGSPWEEARLDYFDPMVTGNIAAILGDVNNTDASKYENILDELEDDHKQSIEDFCERVHQYIESKPAGFRLNFFVDEVGQYISENTKLMLNLQTIAETLATRTKGASWILVTSQEDMERVVGDMNKSQQNDFSRIQARFKIKIPLTSANVDEVIEKRLLEKNEAAEKGLEKTFLKESSHLKSLLSFSDVGVQFKGYEDAADYIDKYPFVPYQFDLFQASRRALSSHNAFQGKHASVGARSMLGVFQQVIQSVEEQNTNTLVSFDQMYEGIRNELRGEIQSSIQLAERNLDNPLAVRTLKTLFLVKYFRNFKPTQRNISVLLIDRMDLDIQGHNKKVEEALNLLENQSYIQRNGELYEFLTDDEKDIEVEIKNTDIDDQATSSLLNDLLFNEIIRDNKIRYLDNKQDYDFTSKIDGVQFGREKELVIELITENFVDYSNEVFLQSQTMGSTAMKMVLASDAVFMKDLRLYLQTDKYVKQNQSTSNRDEVKRILMEKAQQNAERRRNLVFLANKALATSTVYMNGARKEMGQTSDGKTRVINAFQDLIKSVYPNLRMLGGTQFTEDTLRITLRSTHDDLFGADDNTVSEAEGEVLNVIKRRKGQAERTSLKDLRDYFVRKPYGWYPNALWTLVAKLYKRGKIEVKEHANLLDDEEVLSALLNSAQYGSTLLEPQATFDDKAVRELKEVYKEVFNEACPNREAKDIANDFKDKLNELAQEVRRFTVRQHEYPFLNNLDPLEQLLERTSKKEYAYFLTNLQDFEDSLLNMKEDVLDPVRRFMNGNQLKIYDEIKAFVGGDQANVTILDGNESKELQDFIDKATPYSGSALRDAKELMDRLRQRVIDRISEERIAANKVLDAILENVKANYDFKRLSDENQNEIIRPFLEIQAQIKHERFISNIQSHKNAAAELETIQLNEIQELLPKGGDEGSKEKPAQYIRKNNIHVDFDKRELCSEEDVEEYVEALKKAYLERIYQNIRINL